MKKTSIKISTGDSVYIHVLTSIHTNTHIHEHTDIVTHVLHTVFYVSLIIFSVKSFIGGKMTFFGVHPFLRITENLWE